MAITLSSDHILNKNREKEHYWPYFQSSHPHIYNKQYFSHYW